LLLTMEIMEAYKDLIMSICLLDVLANFKISPRFAGRKKELIVATITEALLPK
jgi:hypothetical protein